LFAESTADVEILPDRHAAEIEQLLHEIPMIRKCTLIISLTWIGLLAPGRGYTENVAITFDDLPLNGTLAPNMTRAGIVHEVLVILKK
jgi:hypothetical protein